jgi:integrase
MLNSSPAKALHRQVTLIWNEAARDSNLGLRPVTVASFRGPLRRIDWSLLPPAFRQDVKTYLSWCGGSDPFVVDARPRQLAPKTLRLRRDQIHAAVSALVKCGVKPSAIRSLAELVTPTNFKSILRQRLEGAGSAENVFNHNLGVTLVQIAREWVQVDAAVLTDLKRLLGKLPAPVIGLTSKNKQFLRQFDDPKALRQLAALPERLWAEVRRENNKLNFRTLAKAQAALAIAILIYLPLRLQNLARLVFDTHLFVRAAPSAISTLELSYGEVKNRTELAYDIPPDVARMLLEYRERIAPKIIGHRPAALFVGMDGRLKSQMTVAWLITSHVRRRIGLVLTPHQFRHLAAKVLLDAEPGGFETVKQLLGHKSHRTTVGAYAGIDSRRAACHHQHLIEKAIAAVPSLRSRTSSPPPASR